MSDDTDDDVPSGLPSSRRKSKKRLLSSDSSTSNSSTSPILTTKRNANYRIVSEESDNDSSGSPIVDMRKRKKVARISSDSDEDSDSSDSVIVRKVKRNANIIESEDEDQGFRGSSSQWETDVSDNEGYGNTQNMALSSTQKEQKDFDSDSSDGQSEKCPICLLSIRKQELGSPESCDHLFCVECILEWSKNMNTCPVDRQEYHLILVRKKINGKIIRQIPIKKPAPPEIPQEDQTFCEICGSGDREDRLLLCDGCDLGFHLECLTPPLQEVPLGSWYCNECDPNETVERELDFMEIHLLLEDQELTVRPRNLGYTRRYRRNTTRLIPRTQQIERVISRIRNNRIIREGVEEEFEEPSSSTHIVQSTVVPQVKKRKNKSSKRPKRVPRNRRKKYRTVYEIDEDTGEIVSKKKQVKSRVTKKQKMSKRRERNQLKRLPKTVKKRLAQQLGICPVKMPAQSLPDVRIQNNNSCINSQRYQAGIPTLHLFGQRDDLDYFSGSEDEINGMDYLVRRRPNHSDVAHFRRAARRKGVFFSPPTAVSSTSDLLGSIMDSQSKLYSRNTTFSVDNSGKFRMEHEKENRKVDVDLKDTSKLAKQTPYGGNNRNGNRRGSQYSYSNNSYHGGRSYYSYDNYGPSSTSENYMSFSGSQNSNNGNYDQDMPQDYTQSTLSSYDRDIDFDHPRRNDQQQAEEESDIDIYSDIEDSVSTSRAEEDNTQRHMNVSPDIVPNLIPNNGSDIDNENIDSDNDMVIDTEKVELASQEEEVAKEDTAVTSSEDSMVKCNSTSDVRSLPHSSTEIQSEAIQSTFEKSKEDGYDDEDAYSEDGCPNFSIYSTESINLAKNTDIGLNATNESEGNIMEVESSTPVTESSQPPETSCTYDPADVYDPETAYDPEAAYNSEVEYEPPEPDSEPDDAYDPERIYDSPEDTYDPEKTFDPDEDFEEENALHSEKMVEENEIIPEKVEDDSVEVSAGKTQDDQPKLTAPCVEGLVDEQSPVSVIEESIKLTDPEEPVKASAEPTSGVTQSVVEVLKPKNVNLNVLYSDSEDEEVVKISNNTFAMGDISTLTEDVSEEERSYTPCLDEKAAQKGRGPDGLDTEMISDDEKNDFDESHEQKAASEGDALEINAKESEMDLIRPEDYEEGEIVDKNKAIEEKQQAEISKEPENAEPPAPVLVTAENKDNAEDKENEPKNKQQSFKKLSKNNKERNYRDKDRSKSREKRNKEKEKDKESTKERKKDKRKEIERYDVRALIAEKPRRVKDKFGRDVRKSSSRSRTKSRSRSYTPKRSPVVRSSPNRRLSTSRERRRKKRSGSSRRRSPSRSRSRSRSRQRKRSGSRSRRRRSASRSKRKRKSSKDRSKRRKKARSISRTHTPNRKRRKEWGDRYSRERAYSAEERWTPSLSRTPEVEPPRHASPSWTPPRVMESAAVDPRNLTVILQNDQNKKKKEKKKKTGKKRESDKRSKRRRKDQTPPPSKEVFASGDNILVSVSFNKENETRERDVFTKKKKEADEREKRKRSLRRKKKNQELSGIKPVAIIDLDRSPFRELTPSPKDIIVLSDEEHVENNNINDSQDICDSSQQVASPENIPVYMTGPKTPPEPQIKFSLPSKQQPMRPLLMNPLHDPEDEMADDQEAEDREVLELSDTHKGPNTPPEPPNSPPSSPDAYDPFEPTKSRSPSPDPVEVNVIEDTEKRNSLSDHSIEKSTAIPSLTPPIADIQPADSQSSLQISRDSSKSPDERPVQNSINKSIVQSTPFTSGSVALTSTPVSSNSGPARINILSSTILSNVSSTIPQRIVLPNVKLSPVKISPVKNVIKSTPIKPMLNKNNTNMTTPNKTKSKNSQQNGNDSSEVISLDFDSPYSPGSSDYEDLFEPPPEVVTKKTLNKSVKEPPVKDLAPLKSKNMFDALFGSPLKKMSGDKSKLKKSRGTKIVGVKLDEDHLKILDELPNSAVEMQVKDKFLKKLNRQERVVEEVKLVLKPYYNKKKIDKEEYKDIMRRAVPKICHNKSGEINPTRIKNLIEAYVKKIRHSKPKVTSSSSYNPLKA